MARSQHRRKKRPSDREVQAFVDGELDKDARAKIEAQLRKDDGLRNTTHFYEAQKRAVQRLYDHVLNEPVPDALEKILKTKSKAKSSHH